jgi:heptosyltransferase I
VNLPLAQAPRSVALLRLSAIGDTCHTVPVLRTMQAAWPQTRFTWIIAKSESRLMRLIEGVEFIIVDKGAGFAALANARRALADRRFDVLLDLQVALRASLIALGVQAPVKLGFDRARARELQWLFTTDEIAARTREHVQDSLLGFTEALGIKERVLRWDIPLPQATQAYARELIPDGERALLISACSSHTMRNWRAERYAAIAEHAVRHHGMRVILTGGPGALEESMGAAIERAARVPLVNHVGRDTLPQLLALLARASALVSPDSGPVHMATMVATPVLGLYAATNPERSGPYFSRQWCIDAFGRAARQFRHCEPETLPWGSKIEEPGVMDLIQVQEVIDKLDDLLRSRP